MTTTTKIAEWLTAQTPPTPDNRWIFRVLPGLTAHDGDTVSLRLDLGFDTQRQVTRGRLYGINAPELASASGLAARNTLQGLLSLCELWAQTIQIKHRDGTASDKTDKYGGGYLILLWRKPPAGDWVNVNAAMIALGQAVAYDGGAKTLDPKTGGLTVVNKNR